MEACGEASISVSAAAAVAATYRNPLRCCYRSLRAATRLPTPARAAATAARMRCLHPLCISALTLLRNWSRLLPRSQRPLYHHLQSRRLAPLSPRRLHQLLSLLPLPLPLLLWARPMRASHRRALTGSARLRCDSIMMINQATATVTLTAISAAVADSHALSAAFLSSRLQDSAHLSSRHQTLQRTPHILIPRISPHRRDSFISPFLLPSVRCCRQPITTSRSVPSAPRPAATTSAAVFTPATTTVHHASVRCSGQAVCCRHLR